MSTSWDWASGVQQTTQQKPTDPAMNAWNAPQSPQGREAPNMYSTGSPGERVDSYSPGTSDNNYQLQPVQNAGYQNYQLDGQQQFVHQQPQYNAYNTTSPPVSAPPSPPDLTCLALAPTMSSSQEAAVVTPQAQVANPFDIFATAVAPAAQPVAKMLRLILLGLELHPTLLHRITYDDFWAQMGFGQIDHAANVSTGSITPTSDLSVSDTSFEPEVNPHSLDERGLPLGGEYYKIRVTTPLLGAIFSSAGEVRNTLYKTASFQFVESLKNRPVVSFRIDGSAAETSGVGIGDVLLNVNNICIPDTDTAVKVFFMHLGQAGHICKTEGQCMVKYDARESMHPRTSREWKPKYVVIGDLLGKPNVIYMYRSKAEYDIAVKQFDITGARILKRGQVRYPNQCSPWYYFVIVREFGLPIKISAESEEELAPVYDGIAGYLAKSKKRGPSTPPKWMQ
ncbi:hypothetical protein QTG54_005373 [Skeletonema marinoi]|uniref:PDZ domain-containing protein n=1 Tax=Skeletonema marinoi TaxID=267567 RepID=A0AAD8YEJ3_9STRA|nr:hypothetical protein QTG54_005373 [Skeletonema marinoi]